MLVCMYFQLINPQVEHHFLNKTNFNLIISNSTNNKNILVVGDKEEEEESRFT